jgi:uncharacterized protein (TIGR03086 family)
MTANPIDQLTAALDGVGELIAGVPGGQWDGPTVCDQLSVRDLVLHMVNGNYLFAAVLGGMPLAEGRTGAAVPASAPAGLAERHRDAAARLTAAFAVPGVLERVVVIPAGTMPGIGALYIRVIEMLVHGWDLARATGQPTAPLPDELAAEMLPFSQRALDAIPVEARPFAPSQPVPDDAPGLDRLAALLGRPVA